MDPLRFNYLLWLWDQITHDPKPEDLRAKDAKDTLDKVEQAVSQYQRQQQVIDELKRVSGCNQDHA